MAIDLKKKFFFGNFELDVIYFPADFVRTLFLYSSDWY